MHLATEPDLPCYKHDFQPRHRGRGHANTTTTATLDFPFTNNLSMHSHKRTVSHAPSHQKTRDTLTHLPITAPGASNIKKSSCSTFHLLCSPDYVTFSALSWQQDISLPISNKHHCTNTQAGEVTS